MKNTIKILIIALTLSSSFAFAQSAMNPKAKEVKAVLSKSDVSDDEVTAAYDDIDHLIDYKISKQTSDGEVSTKDLLVLCLAFSNHDASDAAYDLTYKLKKGNPQEFEKALNQLSKSDQKKIKMFIELSEYEEVHGNG